MRRAMKRNRHCDSPRSHKRSRSRSVSPRPTRKKRAKIHHNESQPMWQLNLPPPLSPPLSPSHQPGVPCQPLWYPVTPPSQHSTSSEGSDEWSPNDSVADDEPTAIRRTFSMMKETLRQSIHVSAVEVAAATSSSVSEPSHKRGHNLRKLRQWIAHVYTDPEPVILPKSKKVKVLPNLKSSKVLPYRPKSKKAKVLPELKASKVLDPKPANVLPTLQSKNVLIDSEQVKVLLDSNSVDVLPDPKPVDVLPDPKPIDLIDLERAEVLDTKSANVSPTLESTDVLTNSKGVNVLLDAEPAIIDSEEMMLPDAKPADFLIASESMDALSDLEPEDMLLEPELMDSTPAKVLPDLEPKDVVIDSTPAKILTDLEPKDVVIDSMPEKMLPDLETTYAVDSTAANILPDLEPKDVVIDSTPANILTDLEPKDVVIDSTPEKMLPDLETDVIDSTPANILPDLESKDVVIDSTPAKVLPDLKPKDVVIDSTLAKMLPDLETTDAIDSTAANILPDLEPKDVVIDSTPAKILTDLEPKDVVIDSTPAKILTDLEPKDVVIDSTPAKILTDLEPKDVVIDSTPEKMLPDLETTDAIDSIDLESKDVVIDLVPAKILPDLKATDVIDSTPAKVLPDLEAKDVVIDSAPAKILTDLELKDVVIDSTPEKMLPDLEATDVIDSTPAKVLPDLEATDLIDSTPAKVLSDLEPKDVVIDSTSMKILPDLETTEPVDSERMKVLPDLEPTEVVDSEQVQDLLHSEQALYLESADVLRYSERENVLMDLKRAKELEPEAKGMKDLELLTVLEGLEPTNVVMNSTSAKVLPDSKSADVLNDSELVKVLLGREQVVLPDETLELMSLKPNVSIDSERVKVLPDSTPEPMPDLLLDLESADVLKYSDSERVNMERAKVLLFSEPSDLSPDKELAKVFYDPKQAKLLLNLELAFSGSRVSMDSDPTIVLPVPEKEVVLPVLEKEYVLPVLEPAKKPPAAEDSRRKQEVEEDVLQDMRPADVLIDSEPPMVLPLSEPAKKSPATEDSRWNQEEKEDLLRETGPANVTIDSEPAKVLSENTVSRIPTPKLAEITRSSPKGLQTAGTSSGERSLKAVQVLRGLRRKNKTQPCSCELHTVLKPSDDDTLKTVKVLRGLRRLEKTKPSSSELINVGTSSNDDSPKAVKVLRSRKRAKKTKPSPSRLQTAGTLSEERSPKAVKMLRGLRRAKKTKPSPSSLQTAGRSSNERSSKAVKVLRGLRRAEKTQPRSSNLQIDWISSDEDISKAVKKLRRLRRAKKTQPSSSDTVWTPSDDTLQTVKVLRGLKTAEKTQSRSSELQTVGTAKPPATEDSRRNQEEEVLPNSEPENVSIDSEQGIEVPNIAEKTQPSPSRPQTDETLSDEDSPNTEKVLKDLNTTEKTETVRTQTNDSSDYDSDFDGDFDVDIFSDSLLPRNIPQDEELDARDRRLIHSMERAIDEAVERLVGVSTDFQWQRDFDTFEGCPETFTGPSPGAIQDYETPYDSFISIWSKDIMDHIARETNRYATQFIEAANRKRPEWSNLVRWVDTNADELYTFFGLNILMGMDPGTTQRKYWKVGGFLDMPRFRQIMSNERYILLSKCLHFADNADQSQPGVFSTELRKMAPIIRHLNKKYMELYNLAQDIVIEESLTLFKGRSWPQAIWSKAGHLGLRSYELCESRTGYLYKIFVNDKDKHAEVDVTPSPTLAGKGTQVVLALLNGLENRGHCVTMDNIFNSPVLARYLKSKGFDCLGTLRVNRKHVPEDISNFPMNMPKGAIVARHSGDVACIAWKDSKLVTMISTYHSNDMAHKVGQSTPVVVQDYSNTVESTDVKEQKFLMYLLERKKCVTWLMKMFEKLLNASVHNAQILLSSTHRDKSSITHRTFREELADSLIKRHGSQSRPALRLLQPNSVPKKVEEMLRKDVKHTPVQSKYSKVVPYCEICKRLEKATRVSVECSHCAKAFCLGECWEVWHNLEILPGYDVRSRAPPRKKKR